MDEKFLEISQIKLRGTKEVKGMRFHDIEGGFGESNKSMLAKEIANIHSRELKKVNELINNNKIRFKENIDIVDLKGTEFEVVLKDHEIYSQNSINRSENIYLLSERGYSKLLKIMDDELAWEKYDELVDGYFNMRAEKKQQFNCIEDIMIAQLKDMKALKGKVQAVEKTTKETKEEVQGLKEAVTLSPNQWRKDTATLINKIANKFGGFQHIEPIRKEAYKLLNDTYGVDINRRLLNKKKNMALEGCSKSKIDKTNYLDVIAEDKKLINGYIHIIGKMAVKYGIKNID